MQTKLVIRNRAFGFQKGASLLEIVAYLGVASVVIIGAISMLTSAFGGANANRALRETVGGSLALNVYGAGCRFPELVT